MTWSTRESEKWLEEQKAKKTIRNKKITDAVKSAGRGTASVVKSVYKAGTSKTAKSIWGRMQTIGKNAESMFGDEKPRRKQGKPKKKDKHHKGGKGQHIHIHLNWGLG